MKPTSRSRCSGITGVCTAPSLASANDAITVPIHVGNCHATRVPAPTPSSRNPAATRRASSRTPSKVTARPSPSKNIGFPPETRARYSTSSQSVRMRAGSNMGRLLAAGRADECRGTVAPKLTGRQIRVRGKIHCRRRLRPHARLQADAGAEEHRLREAVPPGCRGGRQLAPPGAGSTRACRSWRTGTPRTGVHFTGARLDPDFMVPGLTASMADTSGDQAGAGQPDVFACRRRLLELLAGFL